MQDGVISLFVLFSQRSSGTDLSFIYLCIHPDMWVHVQKTTLKETVLCGTITWSEMGKQTIQAKKV